MKSTHFTKRGKRCTWTAWCSGAEWTV